MLATLFVAARISGDGFAQSVDSYDAYVHGESFGLRTRNDSAGAAARSIGDAELIKSWDDQFKAMEHVQPVAQQTRPSLRSIVATLAGDIL